MLILTLTLLTPLPSCYTETTTLQVSQPKNMLIIHLTPTANLNCEKLPSAVLVQIKFTNQKLDVQQILTNFLQNSTREIEISVPNLSNYLALSGAEIVISSYSESFTQQIQQVTLTRFAADLIFSDFTVSYDQKTFAARAAFPKNFAGQKISAAELKITTFENSFLLQNSDITELVGSVLEVNFHAPELSGPLYVSGVSYVAFRAVIGGSVQANGEAVTNRLVYKDQPSVGVLDGFSAYSESIFLKLRQSAYFDEVLAGAESVAMLLAVNNDSCALRAEFSAAQFRENILKNANFTANIAKSVFNGTEMQFSACQDVAGRVGTVSAAFTFFDAKKVPINRLSFAAVPLQQICYKNISMELVDSEIVIRGTGVCAQLGDAAVVTILVYATETDYFNDFSEPIAKLNFQLLLQLEIAFRNLTAHEIAQIRQAFHHRILVQRRNGDYYDSFEPVFQFRRRTTLLVYQLGVMVLVAIGNAIIGALSVFCKRRVRVRRLRAAKTINDDVE
ncbi:hypothetical protein SS50377_28485 [Spironucleus salmonicida]|uniref:Uncharacterized protein n=1 Tax=Spironucleus salmonicida TaxID=348837 RepID=V6LD48_9EUKA|nr:hypothetical protein SS50377_28485 [Spironucleus salmonicida]|eukprot:EST42397.1 Hypothetical protein SS50377_18040 [Spironucleus salmonicida]